MSDDDPTRRIDPDDDETRSFEPFADDETQVVGADDAATRRIEPASPSEPAATQRFDATPAAATGSRTERLHLAAQRSIAGWMIALAIVVALAVGALIGYSQSEGDKKGVVAQRLVSPQGGVLTFEGGGELSIPEGALPTATAITVRKVTNDNRFRLGTEGDASSVLYEPGELDMYVFEPAGLRFQRPVRITLPRRASGTALLVDAPGGPRVVGAAPSDGTVTFETSSFEFEDLR